MANGQITFNMFDGTRKSVYLDGVFLVWLTTSPGQQHPYMASVHGYSYGADTMEEAITGWLERYGTPEHQNMRYTFPPSP